MPLQARRCHCKHASYKAARLALRVGDGDGPARLCKTAMQDTEKEGRFDATSPPGIRNVVQYATI